MATSTYVNNRKKWLRPQAMLFSDNPGTLEGGFYIPTGEEFEDFIILSDHNRGEMSISKERIETRQRMVNGTMRSYHIADKNSIAVSWTRLPSRAFSESPEISSAGLITNINAEQHTVDNGAGGADLLEWYNMHPGPFWVFLSYDNFGEGNFNRYSQVLQMYFSGFDYSVEKRGHEIFDMWNINIALEEV